MKILLALYLMLASLSVSAADLMDYRNSGADLHDVEPCTLISEGYAPEELFLCTVFVYQGIQYQAATEMTAQNPYPVKVLFRCKDTLPGERCERIDPDSILGDSI